MQHTNCDTAIKLFGMKIPFQAGEESPERDLGFGEEVVETQTENKDSKIETETKSDQPLDSPNNNPNTPSIHEEDPNSKTEEKPKKPDKILPCPRCSSMDTKFCYYNNYNVHQPRHFCKACQRYWTAGGTMRNVPVGAGRRKNKSSSFAAAQPPPPPPNFHLVPESDRCSSASSITTLSNSEESSVVAAATSAPFLPWPLYPGIPMPFPHPCWWFPPPPTMATMPAVVVGNKRPREGCVLVPKTLRFDDPNEAAKSSIWATLGIKMEGAGIFDGFQSKSRKAEFGRDDDDEKKKKITNASKASPVLMANPAALSRSINFHESS